MVCGLFIRVLFKNLIGVYLCVLGCFAYITMMNAIPGHVYLEEGESLALDRMIPVSLDRCGEYQKRDVGYRGEDVPGVKVTET